MVTSFDLDKLKELIVLLARHPSVTDLGETKLAKLIYFIDAEAMREQGHSVTGSEYIKHDYGPMPSRQDKAMRRLSRDGVVAVQPKEHFNRKLHHVTASRDARSDLFSSDELRIVDVVLKKHGAKTATELSNLSHLEPAWLEAALLDKMDPALIVYGSEEDPEGL